MDYKIGIRVDGNTQTGMGHIMRCMTIAEAIVARQGEVLFITADENAGEVIQSRGYACKVLYTNYREMLSEVEVLRNIIRQEQITLLLVDSYQAPKEYFEALTGIVKLAYIDEFGTMDLPVQCLINYNTYAEDMEYRERYGKDAMLLLGSKYAPVRREFCEKRITIHENIKNVLITMGGSDPLNITEALLKTVLDRKQFSELHFHVVCGGFNQYLRQIEALSRNHTNVHVYVDVRNMSQLIEQCDVAISAAGSTMYELCTMGIPAITCYYVDNQERIAQDFANKTPMLNAGNYSLNPEQTLVQIADELAKLAQDVEYRYCISRAMTVLVDGKGAERIMNALLHVKV